MFVKRMVVGDLDLAQVTKQNVRVAFVLDAGFRFNIGPHLYLSLDRADSRFDVYLKNRVVVSADEPLPNYEWGGIPLPPDLRSELAIVLHRPKISEEELAGLVKPDRPDLPDFGWARFEPVMSDAYRQLIIALDRTVQRHHETSPTILAPDRVEFRRYLVGEVWILCPRGFVLRKDHFEQMLSNRYEPQYSATIALVHDEETIRRAFGDAPLSEEHRHTLCRALDAQNELIAYEFAHQAEVERRNRDYPAALIMAVIALESAHAALLHSILPSRLPAEMKETDRHKQVDRLLREQGIHALIQVTPFLFLDPGSQPTVEQVRQCQRGLEMRNAIMHAKVKKGRPVMRSYRESDFEDAIDAVLDVYRIFVNEIEAWV